MHQTCGIPHYLIWPHRNLRRNQSQYLSPSLFFSPPPSLPPSLHPSFSFPWIPNPGSRCSPMNYSTAARSKSLPLDQIREVGVRGAKWLCKVPQLGSSRTGSDQCCALWLWTSAMVVDSAPPPPPFFGHELPAKSWFLMCIFANISSYPRQLDSHIHPFTYLFTSRLPDILSPITCVCLNVPA